MFFFSFFWEQSKTRKYGNNLFGFFFFFLGCVYFFIFKLQVSNAEVSSPAEINIFCCMSWHRLKLILTWVCLFFFLGVKILTWVDIKLPTHVCSLYIWVMLTSAVRHWLRIHFRKVFISLLWEIKKAIKILINFLPFSIKTFFN